MSETVTITAPPRDKWMPAENGVGRWRAAFEAVEILHAAKSSGPGKVLRLKIDGAEAEISLDAHACRHLSALLLKDLPS